MKNYISYHIDLSKVLLEIKKTFYIDDFLVKNHVILKDNNEPLVTIDKKDKNIKVSPFWEDNFDFSIIKDQELKYILELEGKILSSYIKSNPTFCIKVRKTVYEKLVEVNNFFKQNGFEIVVKIGYRPLEVQKELFLEIKNYFLKKFPTFSTDQIYKITCEYVSDRDNFTPPHSTGGAVDIILIDKFGKEVDMGYPINYPGEESYITYDLISDEQKKNRNFLCDNMLNFGFANLASEWWHFSYGDPYWAYFYGKKESLYNKI